MEDRLNKSGIKGALAKVTARAARVRISRRIGIILLSVLLFLPLLYAAIGFWALPSYIQSKAQNVVAEKLHRKLLIRRLEFNPFTFTLNVEGVSLSEPDSEEHFISFDQLYVEVSGWSVLRMTPVVTELRLVKPFAHLVRMPGKTRNYDDIIALFKKPDGEAEKEAAKSEPVRWPRTRAERIAMLGKRKFGIYNFQMTDARIELENREMGTKTVISDFNVGMPYLYRGPIKGIARHVEPRLDALVNGKKLEITREIPDENRRDRLLKFDMDNIDLKRIFNYVPFNPAYQFNEERLDLHLSFYFHRPADGQTTVDIGGQAAVRSVRMTQNGKPLFNLEKLDVRLGTNSPANGSYCVDRLEIIRPEIHAVLAKDGGLNFANLLAHADSVSAPDEARRTGVKKVSLKPGEQGVVVPAASQKNEEAETRGAVLTVKEVLVKQGRLSYSGDAEAVSLQAVLNRFDLAIRDTEIDLGARTVNVGSIQSSGTGFDVAMHDVAHAAVRQKEAPKAAVPKAGASLPFTVRIGKFGIANWSGKVRNTSARDASSSPFSGSVSRLGVTVENTEINLEKHTVSVGQVQTSGGHFEALLENPPPKVPVAAAAKADASPWQIRVGKLNAANWSGKLKNSNRLDPFQMPFTATLGKLGVTVDNMAVNLKEQNISMAHVSTRGGHAEVELEPWRKPTSTGKRAAARAALMDSILAAKQKQPAEGFSISIEKAAVADWSARIKNHNTTNRAGLPISGKVNQINLVMNQVKVDPKQRNIRIGELTSKDVVLMGQLEKYEKEKPKKGTAAKPVIIPSEAPYIAHIGKLAISGWTIKGRDLNLKKPLSASITELSVNGQDISSAAGKINQIAVRATVDKTGKFAADGKVGLSP
ncbi:MAG: DUF748 domain-containing protein, partial [Burkholderiaceae bacterium]|nr:DUF748 domain-containing protein [Burkholderiaceae bacterium]